MRYKLDRKISRENIVKGYSKWFGVDQLCAIDKLELLGHKVGERHKNKHIRQQEIGGSKRRGKRTENSK